MTLTLAPVTGALFLPDDVTPVQGTVTLTPNSGPLVDPVSNRILTGAVTLQFDALGSVAVQLPRTDSTGIQPAANSWNWRASFNLVNGSIAPFNFALTGPVDLADVIQVAALDGDYIVVPGPQGLKGDKGDKGDAGTGGGSADRTARVRIIDDNLSGLPSAPTWTVVVTSAGTPLVCKVRAAVGDRIELYPNWMREGSHFTDHVILKASDSSIWGYASADGGPTPGSEGNPDMYPALNESYVTSADEFTVAAENIDADGFVTIGVAHQGTGTGKVFAHPVYPWRLRLKNIGAEPV